jgi:anthranilate phosphoribosyltransferase
VISVSQQQSPRDVSIDEIPVDIANTQSSDVHASDVPEEIESITRGLAGEQPPTNPIVVLKAARWWYLHGKGGTDPAFQWAIEWARHLATDTPSDVERFDEFLEYLVTVGFADERHELR